MAFSNSIQVLQGFARKQVSDAQKILGGSTDLASKIKGSVIGSFDKTPIVRFTMPDYAGFVDTGVKGVGYYYATDESGNSQKIKVRTKKTLNSPFANAIFGFRNQPAFSGNYTMIPPKAIDKWVVKKGIEGTRDDAGRFVSRNSLKFAIAKKIYQRGLGQGGSYQSAVGKGFFSKPLAENLAKMNMDLGRAYAHDLANDLKDNLV
tara:strand:- start:81 stop:695 length:615 start_codon:yes stop_codon:yes gene_type:complete